MKELILYPDQLELFEKVRAAMKRQKSNLIVSPTGSGKTAIASHMMKSAAERDKRVIFTVPRRNLMEQTSNTFDSYGIKHSYVSAGKSHNPYAKIFIGTIDTMARRVEQLPKADLLICDETHYGEGALEKVINHYKQQGSWVLGLSATPWKLSGKGLGCWYDSMVEGKTVKWLIENERLSKYRYFIGKTRLDLSKLKVSNGDYNKSEVSDFMEHQGAIIGDCVSDYKNRCMGNIHIVRCVSIKHSQMMAQSFRDASINAAHVDGNTSVQELRTIFRAFALRELAVVCFCDLIGFGFDLSQFTGIDICIESASDTQPSKSLARQSQFWGRVLRMKDKPAIFNDHVNNYVEHGFPDDEREWTLEDRSQSRTASEERATPVKSCTECFFAHKPAPVCPNCGHTYPIKYREVEEIDGELVEIDPATAARQDKQKREQKKAQLVAVAKKRGYANPQVWAENIIRTQGIR